METKELIQEIVKKEGVTPYRIAKDMGIEPSNIYSWQKGRSKPSRDHFVELLRRAGRLAAVVFLGAFVGAISAPSDALASPAKSLIYIQKHCVLCQIIGAGV